MKNQIKPIIAALLLSSVFYSNARTLPASPTIKTFATNMYKTDGKSMVNVFINKLQGSKLKMVIKDEAGIVVHKDFMGKKETKFRTKFNFSELEKGAYSIEFTDGKNIEIKKFSI